MARHEVQSFTLNSNPTLGAGETSDARRVSLYEGLKSIEVSGAFSGASISIEAKVLNIWTPVLAGINLVGLYTIDQPVTELRIVVAGGTEGTALQVALAGFNSRSI